MKLLRVFVLLALVSCLAVAINLHTISTSNTDATHFDTIIVLGHPANEDGTPAPKERVRVSEAVREYRAGRAAHIIFTGGAAHNRWLEAHVMAGLAIEQGVPPGDVLEEPQALNTIQNIYYSAEIMQAHGWNSAEIISTPEHLPRAAMILTEFDKLNPGLAIRWETHPSNWPPEYSLAKRGFLDAFEATRCLEIRIFGLPRSRFLPRP